MTTSLVLNYRPGGLLGWCLSNWLTSVSLGTAPTQQRGNDMHKVSFMQQLYTSFQGKKKLKRYNTALQYAVLIARSYVNSVIKEYRLSMPTFTNLILRCRWTSQILNSDQVHVISFAMQPHFIYSSPSFSLWLYFSFLEEKRALAFQAFDCFISSFLSTHIPYPISSLPSLPVHSFNSLYSSFFITLPSANT
jgi:hypothetical protein